MSLGAKLSLWTSKKKKRSIVIVSVETFRIIHFGDTIQHNANQVVRTP